MFSGFSVDNVLAVLAGFGGLGTLISMVVNLLKVLHVVQDGTSDRWVQGFNLASFLIVSLVLFFNIPVDWGVIDTIIMFLVTLLGFVGQLFGSQLTYKVTRGLPLIGFSFDKE